MAPDQHRSAERTTGGADTGLRAARAARGWSQTGAARALGALARHRGVAVATAASLKTQLSRWENGHATPDAPYRALLTELYAGSDLGLETAVAPATPPGERLRARVAAAGAVDAEVVALWEQQLTALQGLDDRLGSGAADAVRALTAQLDAVLPHLPDPPRRRAVAVLLARSALLAGDQSLDADDPDDAVARYARAGEVARSVGASDLAVRAALGHAEALIEAGAPDAALAVVEHAPPVPPWARAVRAVTALARAAAGDHAGARRALDDVDPTGSGADVDRPAPDRRADSEVPDGIPGTLDRTAPPAGLVVELDPGVAQRVDRAADPEAAKPDPAAVEHRRGRALALLGDPAAVGHLERALAAGPGSCRVRAAVHADLAHALAAAGRTDAAARHADTARDLARRTGSRRVGRLGPQRPPAPPPEPVGAAPAGPPLAEPGPPESAPPGSGPPGSAPEESAVCGSGPGAPRPRPAVPSSSSAAR